MSPRLLHVSQGVLPSGTVAGPSTTAASLRHGAAAATDWEVAFTALPPWTRPQWAITLDIPGLAGPDLDLVDTRWLLVEGWRGRRAITAAQRNLRPDVLHVNSHTPAVLSVDAMRRTPTLLAVDVPVLEWRQMSIWRPVRRATATVMRPPQHLERRAFRAAAAVVAYSGWAAEAVRRAHPGVPVRVIHPGIDVGRYVPATRRDRDRPRILFVGGRFAAKGGDTLLDAFGDRLGSAVDLDIVTPDDVPARPGVTVHRLRSGDARLVDLFQQADLLCLPTFGDASPWVLLEAMACGTPVVSTPIGGIPEIVGAGDTAVGRLVDPGDARSLRHAVTALLDDDAARARLGRVARARIEADYDAVAQTRRLLDLAETVRRPQPAERVAR